MSAVGRSAPVVAGAIAVCLTTFSGCRSASQTDLVEREMRQQEDQIFALQDYLADYQQLLCEYRRENEALKRQLVTGQFRDGQPSRRRRDTRPRRPTPAAEPAEPLPDDEFTPPSDIPPLEFEESDVPPLETTSADDVDAVSLAIATGEYGDDGIFDAAGGNVTRAAFEEPLPVGEAERSVEQVLVRGEVWPGDAATGPRVLVNIDPLTASGRPAEFHGNVSLMVLEADGGGERSLARWDFAPDQWQPMVVAETDGTALEFPLQLPAEVPADRPVELWVRLVPDEGEKLLAHTAIDFGRRGRFASSVSTRPTVAGRADGRVAEQSAIAVVRGSPDPAPIGGVVGRPRHKRHNLAGQSTGPVRQSDWQTARPGEVPQPTASPARNISDWRTATQPIPAIAEPPIYPTPPPRGNVVRGSPKHVVRGSPKHVVRGSPDPAPIDGMVGRPRHSETPPPETPRAPKWSPDRPGIAAAVTASTGEDTSSTARANSIVSPPRPVWSPER